MYTSSSALLNHVLLVVSRSLPDVRFYGDHHILLIIADNFRKTLPRMRRPEVRERVLRQAWEVLELNPKHAKAEKLRWIRFRAPHSILKKPVTYPHIYCEEKHVLPEWITEMMDGSWTEKYPSNLAPKLSAILSGNASISRGSKQRSAARRL
jgi:hypothetical protein